MDRELYHFGIKGMKWGVRRYRNKDGSLTPAGKRRISKEYKKSADRVTEKLTKTYTTRYVNAYNKVANDMNNGGTDRFNERQRKKYGPNYAQRPEYEEEYFDILDSMLERNLNKSLKEFYDSDPDYKRSKELADRYNMTSWDELAKKNEDTISELRSIVEKYD